MIDELRIHTEVLKSKQIEIKEIEILISKLIINKDEFIEMTNYQRSAFSQLARSGRPNTLSKHTKIAVGALETGGANTQQARGLVAQSLWNLRNQRVTASSNIPWNL